MSLPPALVVLSGGAESVSLAIAEAAWVAGVPYGVISLAPKSMLKGLPGCIQFTQLKNADLDSVGRASEVLFDVLARMRGTADDMLAVLPTEDDGLRLLNTLQPRLGGIAEFPRMRRLRFGGLDKGELFESLRLAGLSHLIAPTLRLTRPEDVVAASEQLGVDLIVKPIHKPWRSSWGPSGLKVLSLHASKQGIRQLEQRLGSLWERADGWIAQQRLHPLSGGERSSCVVRSDILRGCEVIERRKHPVMGGSAVWVQSRRQLLLSEATAAITDALDLRGMCELSFLRDDAGHPRLLELNTRPWLQLLLVERSGYPIVIETMKALKGESLDPGASISIERDWIQPERALLSLFGVGRCRLQFFRDLIGVMSRRPVLDVYSCRLPGARRRWIWRNTLRVRRSLLGL